MKYLNAAIRYVPRVGAVLALMSFLIGLVGGIPAKIVLHAGILFAFHAYVAMTLWDFR